jgi:hypothetical protein
VGNGNKNIEREGGHTRKTVIVMIVIVPEIILKERGLGSDL